MLGSETAAQPVAIVLEDFHWSDLTSLELLRHLSQGIDTLGILLVATYRSDELGPEHPLFQLLPHLIREAQAERIDLLGLDLGEVQALVANRYVLSAHDETRLVTYLQSRAEGNPFYLMELLRSLESDRLLYATADGWSVGELAQRPVPPLVQQIIDSRLNQVDRETLRLLEIAAVIGQDVPLELWQAASGAASDQLSAAVERACAARLMVELPDTAKIVFSHALIRETLYFRQSRVTRQTRHRTVAELLSDRPDAASSVVASHFANADDPRAIDWFVRTGEQALALYAARDAIAALSRAQEIAVRFSHALPAAAYRARAAAATLLGEFEHARRNHELALERGRAIGDRHAEWQALLDLGMLWAERDYQRTAGYYRGALALAREIGDAATVAYSLNRVANWHVNLDEPDIAGRLHEEALALFSANNDRAGIADTLDFLGTTSYLDADFPRSTIACEQAIGLFRELGDRQRLSSCLALHAASGGDVTWIASPLYREPRSWVRAGEEALAIAREITWPAGEAFALMCLSLVTVSRGDLGHALRYANAALDIAERIGHQQWTIVARQSTGAVWIELLDVERANHELEQALVAARVTGSRFWVNTMVAMLASLHVANGELDRAAAILGTMAPPSTAHMSLSQRQCRFVQGELALAHGDPDRALAILDELIETRARPSTEDRLPQLMKLRGDILVRMQRAAEAEQVYLTARDDASLLEYRPLAWRIEGALGAFYLAQGRTAEAEAALQRARSTIEEIAETIDDPPLREAFRARARARIPGERSPAPDALATRLSPRERDVLRLLVNGKSDREIAAALFISPRTVMRHVTGILNKLGVSSRTAAASLAIRQDFE